jgi:hypothetical protein
MRGEGGEGDKPGRRKALRRDFGEALTDSGHGQLLPWC